jgi:hypothetical protein
MNEQTALLGGDVQARRPSTQLSLNVPHHQTKREWREDVSGPHES